ncbi:hypothetical protein [Pontibaca methylaminivorans]|uniref:Glycosyl transferase family 2 n=1 Tax=Pontibaca methylaminivorans TaxID=515897 RepID=A0A1R3WDH9_9RHOB|nr:hypothetical protein [Pontibaca methylaminivorans]SIT74437.1 hypothetical protein SAMN05421849_0157 [Pontibaca methylaminivorans]
MTICFILIDTGPGLEDSGHSLNPLLQAGDQVLVLAESGSAKPRFPALNDAIETGHIAISDTDMMNPDLWAMVARTHGKADVSMFLRAGDLICAEALDSLRTWISDQAGSADVIVVNRAFSLVGEHVTFPCPDAPRWPDGGGEGRTSALRLMADPARLVLSRTYLESTDFPRNCPNATWYDEVIQAADTIGLFPDPVVLTRPTQSTAETMLQHLDEAISARNGERTDIAALRLNDQLSLLEPDELAGFTDRANDLFRRVPRRVRKRLCLLPGISGALFSAMREGGKFAAIGLLLLANSDRQRRRLDALSHEVNRLRSDLNAALPGPEYLQLMHEMVRQ